MKRQDAWNILDELNRLVAAQGESILAQALVRQLEMAGYSVQAVRNQQGNLVRYRPDFSAGARNK